MSHPDKTIKTTNKRSRMIRDEKSKSSCIHALLFSPGSKNITLLRTSFLRFSNISQSEIPVQEDSKTSKTKEATKEIRWTRNARRHEMYRVK